MLLFNKPTAISYISKSGDKVYPVVIDIKEGVKSSETLSFMTADVNTGILSVAFVEGETNYSINDATIVCSIQRPDGSTLELVCTKVADNIVEVPLGVNGTSQQGNYLFDFKIARVGSKTIGVPLLNYNVNSSISSEDIVQEDDRLPILNELISTIENTTTDSKNSTMACNQATVEAITATNNIIKTTQEANDVLVNIRNAISSGTVDLEVKEARGGEVSLNSRLEKFDAQLDCKLNSFYGSINAGKILVVGEDGYLVLDDMPEGTTYPVVGTVDENNVITLSSDKLVDGLYTLRYSDADGYEEIGKLLVGERVVTKIVVTKVTTVYDEGATLATNDITVKAYYNDGSSSYVTGYTVDTSSVNMNTKGTYQLKVHYMNCTTSVDIVVNPLTAITGNLFVASTCTIGKRISSSGDIRDQTNTFLTNYIDIGKCMSNGTTNIIRWQGFHLYAITSSELTNAGLVAGDVGVYRGVAYYDSTGKFLGQDTLYVSNKEYDSEGSYIYTLNKTYSNATRIRLFGVTLPPAKSVNELQDCKLTLNQLISEI